MKEKILQRFFKTQAGAVGFLVSDEEILLDIAVDEFRKELYQDPELQRIKACQIIEELDLVARKYDNGYALPIHESEDMIQAVIKILNEA